MSRSHGWVWACALTPGIIACGGTPTIVEPPPAPPTASLTLNTTQLVLPGSVVTSSVCGGSSTTASRSWNNLTALSAVETTSIGTAGPITFTLVCRNATGDSAVATKQLVATKPILSGKFGTYNTGVGHLGELWVYLIGSDGTDSARVDTDGSWSVSLSSWNDACVLLRETHPQGLIDSWSRPVCRVDWGSQFLYTLKPRTIQIVGGRYDGTLFTIDLLEDAYNRYNPTDGGSSALSRSLQNNGCWYYSLATWPKESRPVPLAIDSARSLQPVSDSAIAAMWVAIRAKQAELGMEMVRPENFSDASYTTSNDVEVWRGVLVRTRSSAAEGGIHNLSADGRDILSSLVTIDVNLLGDSIVMNHELMHGNDIYHMLETLMTPVLSRGDPAQANFGPKLVAIIQMLYADGDLARLMGGKSGFPGTMTEDERAHNVTIYPVCSAQQ